MYHYRRLSTDEQRAILAYRVEKGLPRHAPPHPHNLDGWFLISAATYEHQSHFASANEQLHLVEMLLTQLTDSDVEFAAWVVLPNHYHVLVRTTSLDQLAAVFRKVHGRSSREVNLRDRVVGRKVWYRYADRKIRSERHYWTTVNYIHSNPVKHGWSKAPAAWSASSIHDYVERWSEPELESLWRDYPLLSYGAGWDDGDDLSAASAHASSPGRGKR